MTNSILELIRKNSNLKVDQQSQKPSMEESDVVVNITQATDDAGTPVDTADLVEGKMVDAELSKAAVDNQEPAIANAVNDVSAMESNRALLKRHLKTGGIDQQAAAIVMINIDNASRRINLNAAELGVPSVESFGGTAGSMQSTKAAYETTSAIAAARRVVAVEAAMVQAEAIGEHTEDLSEIADDLAARAAKLEGVVANITGDTPASNVEMDGLASRIGSTNGSVGAAASNLANYTENVLVRSATMYNNLGTAIADVESQTDPVVGTEGEATPAATEVEADLTADSATADTAAEAPIEGTEGAVAVENVDKDTLVNEDGKEKTVAKPEKSDPAADETPAESAEGTQVATQVPEKPTASLENEDPDVEDPDVSDIADNIETKEEGPLPGDATVEFADKEEAGEWIDEENPDLGAAADKINATDVSLTANQYQGTSLPVLGQAEALLILKSVSQICSAVNAHQSIVASRGNILEGMRSQAVDVTEAGPDSEEADVTADGVDFNLAIYRKVSEAERTVATHALNSARDLITYVGLSCKAYDAAPVSTESADAAPAAEAPADAGNEASGE